MKFRSLRSRALICTSLSMIAATPAAAQVIGAFDDGSSVERSATTGNGSGSRLPTSDRYGDILAPVDNGPDGARRGVPVILRERPSYDPPGLPAGGFTFYPEATVGLTYNSNIYSQDDGVSDVSARARASGALQSNWGRHALAIDGFVDQRSYAKYDSEDAFTYAANAAGRLNVGVSSQISAELRHSRQVVDRSAIGEDFPTRRPVRYDLSSVGLGGRHSFGRINVNLTGGVSKYDFKDAQTPAGLPSDQQYRDFNRYQAGIDLSYGFSAGPRAFVSVNGEWRRYRVDRLISRDADIYEILGGVRGEITPLLQGAVGIGYITSNFSDPTIKSRSAVALSARLSYLLTELTTINLSARRYYQNVGLVSAPASLNTEGLIGVDHELLRNVVLSASVNYAYSDYIASAGSARRYGSSFNVLWLINRNMRFDVGLDYRRRTNDRLAIAREFDVLRTSATFRYHL